MDLSIAHFEKAVAALGKATIMGSHQQGYALGGHQFEQQFKDEGADLCIERARRLIGQQDLRLVHQGPAERGALAFSAGELLNAMPKAMFQAGALCQVQQARLRNVAIDSRGDCGNKTVFLEREIGDEIVELKDEAHFVAQKVQQVAMAVDGNAIDQDSSVIRCIEAAEEMKERAFSAP
jgi:hypothetical protein